MKLRHLIRWTVILNSNDDTWYSTQRLNLVNDYKIIKIRRIPNITYLLTQFHVERSSSHQPSCACNSNYHNNYLLFGPRIGAGGFSWVGLNMGAFLSISGTLKKRI